MFAYMKYNKAKKVALVYPGVNSGITYGHYDYHTDADDDKLGLEKRSVISLAYNTNIRQWQEGISEYIDGWIQKDTVVVVDC